MANKIVKDSALPIFVKNIEVPADAEVNDLVRKNSIIGLCGQTPRVGEDGKSYATVDTAAHIRIEGVTGAFQMGAPVYVTSSLVPTGTATDNTKIGYAALPKASGSGDLHVQLIPSA